MTCTFHNFKNNHISSPQMKWQHFEREFVLSSLWDVPVSDNFPIACTVPYCKLNFGCEFMLPLFQHKMSTYESQIKTWALFCWNRESNGVLGKNVSSLCMLMHFVQSVWYGKHKYLGQLVQSAFNVVWRDWFNPDTLKVCKNEFRSRECEA